MNHQSFREKVKSLLPKEWGPEDILRGVKVTFIAFIICMTRLDIFPVEIILEIIYQVIYHAPNHAINPLRKFKIPNLNIYGGTSLCILTGSPVPPTDWYMRLTDEFLDDDVLDSGVNIVEMIAKILGHTPKLNKIWKVTGRVFIEATAGWFKFSIRVGCGYTTDADIFESSIEYSLLDGKKLLSKKFPNYNPRRFRFQWATREIYDKAIQSVASTHESVYQLTRSREMFFRVQEERFKKHQERLSKVGVNLIKVYIDKYKCVCVGLYRYSYLCMDMKKIMD